MPVCDAKLRDSLTVELSVTNSQIIVRSLRNLFKCVLRNALVIFRAKEKITHFTFSVGKSLANFSFFFFYCNRILSVMQKPTRLHFMSAVPFREAQSVGLAKESDKFSPSWPTGARSWMMQQTRSNVHVT